MEFACNVPRGKSMKVKIASLTFAGTLQKLTMCHNGQNISIDINAVPAHLAIGDRFGNCL